MENLPGGKLKKLITNVWCKNWLRFESLKVFKCLFEQLASFFNFPIKLKFIFSNFSFKFPSQSHWVDIRIENEKLLLQNLFYRCFSLNFIPRLFIRISSIEFFIFALSTSLTLLQNLLINLSPLSLSGFPLMHTVRLLATT